MSNGIFLEVSDNVRPIRLKTPVSIDTPDADTLVALNSRGLQSSSMNVKEKIMRTMDNFFMFIS